MRPRRELFKSFPAGRRNHHSARGGLLKHTFEVFEFVKALHASPVFGGTFDLQLALQGALCHDYGKIYEYIIKDEISPEINYWMLSAGHLALGAELIADAASRIQGKTKQDLIRLESLKHIVRSHHLKPEWGAVVAPATKEAFLVFLADYWSMITDKEAESELVPEAGFKKSQNFRENFIDFQFLAGLSDQEERE